MPQDIVDNDHSALTAEDEDTTKAPLVCEDGWHCEPQCPFMYHKKEIGMCRIHGELDWYDYYIAACVKERND